MISNLATIIGSEGYAIQAPNADPPMVGCCLLGDGDQLAWSLRPPLLQPAVGPTSNIQVLTPVGWTDLPAAVVPAGSGSELQYRNGSNFGAISGSSVSGSSVTLTGTIAAASVSASNNVDAFQLILSSNARLRNGPTYVDGDLSILKVDATTLGNMRSGMITLGNPALTQGATDWAKIKATASGAITLRNANDTGDAQGTGAKFKSTGGLNAIGFENEFSGYGLGWNNNGETIVVINNSPKVLLGSSIIHGGSFGLTGSMGYNPTADVVYGRNVTGPAAQIQAASGLNVMNAAGSAVAPVTCSQVRYDANYQSGITMTTADTSVVAGNNGPQLYVEGGYGNWTMAAGNINNTDNYAKVVMSGTAKLIWSTYDYNCASGTGRTTKLGLRSPSAGVLQIDANAAGTSYGSLVASKYTADSFASGDAALVVETFTDPANTSVKAARIRTATGSRRLYIGDSSNKFYAADFSGCTTVANLPNISGRLSAYEDATTYPLVSANPSGHSSYQKTIAIRNPSSYDVVTAGQGNLSTDGGVLTLWPGVVSQTDYLRMEYNAGGPRLITTRPSITVNADSGLVVKNNAGSADSAIASSSVGPSSVNANFRINVPMYGATSNYGELYFNNSASYHSYLNINAPQAMSSGSNTFGMVYYNNNQFEFGFYSGAKVYFSGSGAQGKLLGLWSFPSGSSYPSPNLASDSSGGSDVRWTISKTGNGANQTVTGYTYAYGLTGIPAALDLRARSIQLGAYTDVSSGHVWNDTNISNKILLDASGFTVTGLLNVNTDTRWNRNAVGAFAHECYETSLSAWQTGHRQEASASGIKESFFGATPILKPSVTGSRGGNAALASLLTSLANLGLVTDSTSA